MNFRRRAHSATIASSPAAASTGVAIALRGGGLVAPALHDVDRRNTDDTTRALLNLVRRTRAGSLRSRLADATLTGANLGERRVDSVFGVICPDRGPRRAAFSLNRSGPWARSGPPLPIGERRVVHT